MSRTKELFSDRIDTEERHELSDDDFGLPDRREFPLIDAAHVRAAEAYFRFAPEDRKAELARNILRKADQYGVNIKSPTILEWAGQS